MIKKVLTFFSFFSLALIFTFQVVLAQTATPTPTDSETEAGEVKQAKIDDLKDRVATKVAQMRNTTYQALTGAIKSADEESLTLTTKEGEVKIVLTDETKTFQINRGKRSTLAISNIEGGERAAAVGSSDPAGDFVAKVILVKLLSQNINGLIEEVDRDNFTISVKSKNGTIYLVDIEVATKTQTWDKEDGFQKSGFSKLAIGDRVHVSGAPDEEKNHLSATRILVLSKLGSRAEEPATPAVSPTKSPTPESTAAPTPSE